MNVTCFTFSSSPPGHAAWTASSNCRGTFDIITLCFSTIIICIWTSIHWDIPLSRLSDSLYELPWWKHWAIKHYRFIKRRGPTVIIAFFFPALLLFRAVNQLFVVWGMVHPEKHHFDKRILQAWKRLKIIGPYIRGSVSWLRSNDAVPARNSDIEAQQDEGIATRKQGDNAGAEKCYDGQKKGQDVDVEVRGISSSQEEPSRQRPQTFTHAFYAIMGGYAFAILDEYGKIFNTANDVVSDAHSRDLFPPHLVGAKLTAEGLQFLKQYDPHLVPYMTRAMISERTKANSFAKAVMSLQVIWFCLNTVSRLNEGLPLSLLEVSTLAHGFCTLLSCATWWCKPLNIDSPSWIRMDTDEATEAFALMFIIDGREREKDEFRKHFKKIFDLRGEVWTKEKELRHSRYMTLWAKLHVWLQMRSRKKKKDDGEKQDLWQWIVWEVQTRQMEKKWRKKQMDLEMKRAKARIHVHDIVWERTGDRNPLVCSAIVAAFRFGFLKEDFAKRRAPLLAFDSSPGFRDLFGAFTFQKHRSSVIVSAVAPAIYGSLHILGWHTQFPTVVERTLWRIATVIAMSPGAVATVSFLVFTFLFRGSDSLEENVSSEESQSDVPEPKKSGVPQVTSPGELVVAEKSDAPQEADAPEKSNASKEPDAHEEVDALEEARRRRPPENRTFLRCWSLPEGWMLPRKWMLARGRTLPKSWTLLLTAPDFRNLLIIFSNL
ncbi:hypothetical protein SCHPADRAFT_944017 [Schizopora paradoxa]|uniref:Uncharacterized protein n=1 Tax=Schizopora paradoxa TaxID=27342 RepID=A0A0H2RAT1_9AGAM|nr:hypothetical protein SCHPADRAFT_944017 [Schizopora paradoxa]